MTILEAFVALFFPGIAVGMKRGFLSREAGLAWLLQLFGHIPGVIYALAQITKD